MWYPSPDAIRRSEAIAEPLGNQLTAENRTATRAQWRIGALRRVTQPAKWLNSEADYRRHDPKEPLTHACRPLGKSTVTAWQAERHPFSIVSAGVVERRLRTP
jgi:hypothetical protein